jgi:mono/diheme cytochrome c family protein
MSNRNSQISRLTVFIVPLAVFLAACDGSPSNRDSNPFHLPPDGFVADKDKGAELFRQNCSACHGRAGSGSNKGPPLVHKTYNPSHPQPQVSPEAAGHIVAYVRALQRRAGIK